MVAVKVTDLREELSISDDEEWKQIRLDAGEIFVAHNCHRQCGKSQLITTCRNNSNKKLYPPKKMKYAHKKCGLPSQRQSSIFKLFIHVFDINKSKLMPLIQHP